MEKEILPILPTRNVVLFPGVTISVALVRESSLETARKALDSSELIGVVCQQDESVEDPVFSRDLYNIGVRASVSEIIEMQEGSHCAIIRALDRFRILEHAQNADDGVAQIEIPDMEDVDSSSELVQLCNILASKARAYFSVRPEGAMILDNYREYEKTPIMCINYLCTYLPVAVPAKIAMLEMNRPLERATALLTAMLPLENGEEIRAEIQLKTQEAMAENSRNAFLQQEMETIRTELYGDAADELDSLLQLVQENGMPQEVLDTFGRELEKARHFNPQSPDYAVQYAYLQLLASLPWLPGETESVDIRNAAIMLNEDHYGLEKLKERVLEQLAVILHRPEGRAPILCLVGPPGVGKTSVGRSIARVLGRKYERVSLGGVHDEAEIRGHRRTYIGAMPGRLINAIRRAGVSNPVIVLDEIDKLSSDVKGDPASALLEVLDPEQNNHFHDNYVDVDYDLSKVLFIATANNLAAIPKPLLDRMELLEVDGYLVEEKMEIARRHLLPRLLSENELSQDEFVISDEGLQALIETYTAESGVRQLEKKLATLTRKFILRKLRGEAFPSPVNAADLHDILGLAPRLRGQYEYSPIPGIVTGLAWTEIGGEILTVESSLSQGKGEKLVMTGRLGEVMKESASIAYQWVKSNAAELAISPEDFETHTLHIHFPEGAIPKDGPSAGITIATSIVSTMTGRLARKAIAMTGEITLRGKVLPVGGIREKILAAKRAGIKTVILSESNRRDIEDIAENYTRGLAFEFVENMSQVISLALD